MSEIATKPYLLRALYEWCVDNGYTPHVAVRVDSRTQVPAEYVKNGEITLNISPNAVHKLQMGNELIEFSARFGGVARQLSVPVANVYALYARETGHGMTFDVDGAKPSVQSKAESEPREAPRSTALTRPTTALPATTSTSPEPPKKPSGGGKPTLRRIK
jgi:stringent starvation protein B